MFVRKNTATVEEMRRAAEKIAEVLELDFWLSDLADAAPTRNTPDDAVLALEDERANPMRTVDEMAQKWGVSEHVVRRWIKDGAVRPVRLSSRMIRIRASHPDPRTPLPQESDLIAILNVEQYGPANNGWLANEPSVYFIEAPGVALVKIGRASNLRDRITGLRHQSPIPLRLVARMPGYEEETELHRRFAHLRAHGEWFKTAPELVEFVHTVRRQYKQPYWPEDWMHPFDKPWEPPAP